MPACALTCETGEVRFGTLNKNAKLEKVDRSDESGPVRQMGLLV
jgi:hypothetical protein